MTSIIFGILITIVILYLIYLLVSLLMKTIPTAANYIVVFTTIMLIILFYPFTNKRKEDFIKNPTSTRIAIFLWFIMWLMIAFLVMVLILVK